MINIFVLSFINPKNKNYDLQHHNQGKICLNILDLNHFNYKSRNFASLYQKISSMQNDDIPSISEEGEVLYLDCELLC